MRFPFPGALVTAAQFERDRRAVTGPKAVAEGRVDAETATLDYQAWCAIADWMACGRSNIIGAWGGVADPPVTPISWGLLADCATKGLASIKSKLASEQAFAAGGAKDPKRPGRVALSADDIAALQLRHDCLVAIDLAVTRQAQLLDDMNRALREAVTPKAAAA